MAQDKRRKDRSDPDFGSLLGGISFLTEADSKKLADTLFEPERRRWEVRYNTLNALNEIAAIQSQQAKTLANLEKDTAQNARAQDKVNRTVIWLTGSGLVVALISLLVAIGIGLGYIHPPNQF